MSVHCSVPTVNSQAFQHLKLGASLYVPATHPNLIDVVQGKRLSQARSVIFCLEDAVAEKDLEKALDQILKMLSWTEKSTSQLRFIRARNPDVFAQVLSMKGIDQIDGFVLPKITAHNIETYVQHLPAKTAHWLMPTLETQEVFEEQSMLELRQRLEPLKSNILSLRIGGNDLLNLLSLRRLRGTTLYQTPISGVVNRLVGWFKPHGYNLTAPVYDVIDDPETLRAEVQSDLVHGLFGKTAIHPGQLQTIEHEYRVGSDQLKMAEIVLAEHAPAVFMLNQHMCEPATHRKWAEETIERACIYGITE